MARPASRARGSRSPWCFLAAGLSADAIVASHLPLRVEDVRASTAYAAELAGA
jgi:hypothetical protein